MFVEIDIIRYEVLVEWFTIFYFEKKHHFVVRKFATIIVKTINVSFCAAAQTTYTCECVV